MLLYFWFKRQFDVIQDQIIVVQNQLALVTQQLIQVQKNLNLDLKTDKENKEMSQALDEKISKLTDDVAAVKGVGDSLITLVNGLATIIADLKANATTPEQLQAIDDLSAKLEAEAQAMADAVAANPQT